jgi:hypothetical protein
MERKILVTGIILAICISVIIGVIFIYSGAKSNANPIKVIPQDAAYVVRLNGLKIAEVLRNEKTTVWHDLKKLELFKTIDSEIEILDSLIKKNEKLSVTPENSPIYVSGHYSGGKNINHLILFGVPANFNERDVNAILSKQTAGNISNFSERKYEGKTIFSVSLSSKRILYLTISNGVLVYSSSPVLIEDAIRQSTLNLSLLDNAEFSEMINATGKHKLANLFIDFTQIGKLTSLIGKVNYSDNFKSFKQFGDWCEFDLNIKGDLLFFNGFSPRPDNEVTLLSTIAVDKPVRLNIDQILPASTSAFLAFGVSSPTKSYIAYLNYLKEIGKYSRYKANLENMNSKYGIEFDKFFLGLLDDEIAISFNENVDNESHAHFIALKCKSGSDAENQLIELTEKIQQVNNAAKTQNYSPDETIHFNIHKLPIYPLFGRLLGDFFNVFEECYLTVVDNYLIVTGNFDDATRFIHSYMLQKTLANEEVYRDFAENISMKSYALGYFDLTGSSGFFSRFLKEEFLKNWERNKQIFNNSKSIGFQISEVSGMPYFNILLKRYGSYRGKPKTVWESLLDTTMSLKPSFVVNHYNKQNEIFIQDDKNKVYLINQTGRVLWKFLLSEKINSEIYQIDYYKNGKLQILFSTENYIHLIDRNGNYVEQYPVQLRSAATAGLSLFDYDKNRNYRIFIPCEDKNVYAFSVEGKLLSGWGFTGSDHPVEHSIKQFRVAGKDFIVFSDKAKTYILDRKGNDRVLVKNNFAVSQNNTFYLHNSNDVSSSFLITTNRNGKIVKVFFDGNTEVFDLGRLTPQHFFDYKDVNADGKSDYVLLDDNKLMVFDNAGKSIFSKEIDATITHRPVYYHFSHNNRKIGLVSEEDEKIFLINNNGEIYKNFPLEGRTLFSIGYFDLTSSRFNLIVGGRNNFLYNYAVE